MNESDRHYPRWQLTRDLLVFQAKLLLDGLRDLLLSPISLVAGLMGMVADRNDPSRLFRKVVEAGAASERWINLFKHRDPGVAGNVDELFERLEARILEQYQSGGITAQAKSAIDRSLDAIQRRIEERQARIGTNLEPGTQGGRPDRSAPQEKSPDDLQDSE